MNTSDPLDLAALSRDYLPDGTPRFETHYIIFEGWEPLDASDWQFVGSVFCLCLAAGLVLLWRLLA